MASTPGFEHLALAFCNLRKQPLGTLATEICLIFMCLLVEYDKVLCSSANEHQQNSNASSKEMNIIHEY